MIFVKWGADDSAGFSFFALYIASFNKSKTKPVSVIIIIDFLGVKNHIGQS